MWAIPTGISLVLKKNQVKSPSIWSCVPETGSDPPIGLDRESRRDTHQVPIILRRPFLATANAIINCWNGVMQLTFDNMTLELNIFHLSNKDKQAEDKEKKSEEVCLSGIDEGKLSVHKLQEKSI